MDRWMNEWTKKSLFNREYMSYDTSINTKYCRWNKGSV